MKRSMLEIQKTLADKYSYQPLPESIKWKYRELYVKQLPAPFFDCLFTGFSGYPLFSKAGNCIAKGFHRVVIGDYGAFVEISPDDIFADALAMRKGTEKRMQFENAKYIWLCPTSHTGKQDTACKIYHQKRKVTYADYQPGMYYVSPYDLQYVTCDDLPSQAEVNQVVEHLHTIELKNVGYEQLSF